MPYTYKYKSFESIGEEYSKESIGEYSQLLKAAVQLKREPVGIKFLYTEEDYNKTELNEPKAKMSYCKLVELAGKGHAHKSKLCHHICDGATTALALEESTPRIESGAEYFSYNLYSTQATARRMRESICSMHRKSVPVYGIVTSPLEAFAEAPDVIIIVANPYGVMRMTQGYVYHDGIKPKIDYGAMQALCSELTVVPYETGGMNISSFCPSTRTLARWADDEMGVGIAYERFAQMVEGVLATMKTTDSKEKIDIINKMLEEQGKDIRFKSDK